MRRIIPIAPHRTRGLPPPAMPTGAAPDGALLRDALGRPLRDLRISVTDRCNFRCSYCMPAEAFAHGHAWMQHSELLRFEEITRLARCFVARGVRKLRITGGEPLLRRGLERLIEQLAALRTPDGAPLELALTTNGTLLARRARALKDAGLQRVTVSLDALDEALFARINGVGASPRGVLEGIDAALAAGLVPLKVNVVVRRGSNEGQIVPLAQHFRGSGVALRFIEYMDAGGAHGWRMAQVVPSAQVLARLQREFPLAPLAPAAPGETATRYAWLGAGGQPDARLGEIGLISSVTQPFCHECCRARLSMDGKLFLCLFATQGYELRDVLRSGASDAELDAAIAAIWSARHDRYSALRTSLSPEARQAPRVGMSYIGG